MSEPCLWFRNTLPRSPSDTIGILSESHPDLDFLNPYQSLDQVIKTLTLTHKKHGTPHPGNRFREHKCLTILEEPNKSIFRNKIQNPQIFDQN